ncbi:MAG: protoporphyrinogen oxidase [Gemmataceae bacterium]|nr:protoporphyrinogen oxidase [Gemmataceae bacterium]
MRIVVVGAGISGLSAAYRLQQRLPQAEIAVLEADSRAGGTMQTVRRDGFTVELGPNGFLDTKPSTLNLSHDVGLGNQLLQASDTAGKNRFLFLRDRMFRLPGGPGELLTTRLLTLRGKLSLMAERLRGRRKTEGDESIDAFARRRAGNQAADILADAMVTGIFAGDPKLLSLPACFPRVAQMEREYGSVMKGFAREARKRRQEAEKKGEPYKRPGGLWSFEHGLKSLIEALVANLTTPPIYGATIRNVRKDGDPVRPKWIVSAEGQDRWEADAVLLTCPGYRQSAALADLDRDLSGKIGEIPFNRIAVIALGFRKKDLSAPLDGFGYIAPQSTGRDLLGAQWCSSIYPGHRCPEDAVLVRAMAGGWTRGDLLDRNDDELVRLAWAELRATMQLSAAPIFSHVARWEKGIPQYHLGHLDRVAWIEKRLASHPGLFLGGNSYRGVAMNDCTEQGSVLADAIAGYLSKAK